MAASEVTPTRLPARALGLALLLASVPASPGSADAPACPDGPPAFFLGAVHDSEASPPRQDFVEDLGHLETLVARLGEAYCLPADRTALLAFEGAHGHPAATEAAVRAAIEAFGSAATGLEGATFFLVVSGHGLARASPVCPQGARPLASFVRLVEGDLVDCELGAWLGANLPVGVRVVAIVDCSLCGGFSDSLTPVSGTVPDMALAAPSGMVAPGRIVITGCALSTECWGGPDGSLLLSHLMTVLARGVPYADGMNAPGFPQVEGLDLPTRTGPNDGRMTVSEWFFASVWHATTVADGQAVSQQPRMKYGFGSLADDVLVLPG